MSCQGPILQDEAVCPWAYHCPLWWDCASKPSGACSSPACLLSLGKMLLDPVQLGQDPRAGGHFGILGKGTDSSGQKATILGKNADSVMPLGRRGLLFFHQTLPVLGRVGAGKDSHEAGVGGAVLSIKADRGQGTSAQGQGDQPLALPFSLGLPAIFCRLSWLPAWSRDLTVSSRPCPLGLGGHHCPGRKEGGADQKGTEESSSRRE